MSDTPFFRGPNRFDWLYALALQTAVDWGTPEEVSSVAAILGNASIKRFSDPSGVFPVLTLVILDDFLFVVSASTKTTPQWVGNVLGSAALPVPPAQGSVSAYFGAVATYQYLASLPDVTAAYQAGKPIVLIGFSLGAASVTIMKDMLIKAHGIATACVAIASPRAGTTSFASAYPADNFAGLMLLNDPVPSVPPSVWTGIGVHNSWFPFPPLVAYTHPVPGNTVFLDGSIGPGYALQTIDQVILSFDLGTFQAFHNQAQLAVALRSQNLPDTIPDGFEGYPNAGSFDSVARQVFSYSASWPWPRDEVAAPLTGGVTSMIQTTVYIRNSGGPPLGPKEIYYFNSTDAQSIQNQWLTTYLNLRSRFLSKSCQIYAVRSAIVGGTKSSYLTKLLTPIPGVTGVTEDIEASICIFGFNATRSSKRQFHFRGIDANWITQDALTPAGVTGCALISTGLGFTAGPGGSGFLDVLKTGGLVMNTDSQTIAQGFAISGAAKATQGSLITLTVDPLYTPAVGSLVEITGCRQAPLMNAIWKVAPPAIAGSIVLQGSQLYSAPAGLTGVIRDAGKAPSAVFSYAFNGISSKKTGKPSFLQRGRRSVLLRRR